MGSLARNMTQSTHAARVLFLPRCKLEASTAENMLVVCTNWHVPAHISTAKCQVLAHCWSVVSKQPGYQSRRPKSGNTFIRRTYVYRSAPLLSTIMQGSAPATPNKMHRLKLGNCSTLEKLTHHSHRSWIGPRPPGRRTPGSGEKNKQTRKRVLAHTVSRKPLALEAATLVFT